MTAQQYIAKIEDETRQRLDQAARESVADDTALEVWWISFQRGEYSYARRQWFEVVEPATRITEGK